MLLDALTNMSDGQSLTGIAANATGVSNVVDLGVSRDISVAEVPVLIVWTTLPAGPGGTTINAAIQTSLDNVTWTTLDETSPQPITNYTATQRHLFRSFLPAGVQRYLRVAYTPSAVLTAGTVTAALGADFTNTFAYPRAYVA